MKRYMQSLFMVLLLIFATLPMHAIYAAAKEGKDDDYDYDDDNLYKQPATTVGYAEAAEAPQPTEPLTFWLRPGESKKLEPRLILTYLGSSQQQNQYVCTAEAKLCSDGKTYVGRNPSLGCAFDACPDEDRPTVEKTGPSKGVCEQFQMTYEGVAGTSGKKLPDPVPYDVIDAQEVKTMDVAQAPIAEDVYTAADAAASVQTIDANDLGSVATIVEPTGIVTDIAGDEQIVDGDDIVVQPAPPDTTRRDALAQQIAKLALIIGREEYIIFSFNEGKLAEALVGVLKRKGIIIDSNLDNDWVSEVDEFIKQNKIDVGRFVSDVRKAQKSLSLAQIHTYNAILFLEKNNLDAAEKEYEKAMEHYEDFNEVMARIDAEINRWQYFRSGDGVNKGDVVIRSESKTFCLVPGEVGYPIILYEKKDDAVLVGYNAWKNGDYKPMTDDVDQLQKTKAKSASGSCTVAGDGEVPIGTRLNVDGVSQYCDPLTKKMQNQKIDGAEAENNYECSSNEARNGTCVNSLNFLERIWKAITGIFGL